MLGNETSLGARALNTLLPPLLALGAHSGSSVCPRRPSQLRSRSFSFADPQPREQVAKMAPKPVKTLKLCKALAVPAGPKRGLWTIKAKNGGTFPTHQKAAFVEAPAVRAREFYHADDLKKPLHKDKVINALKLRSSIISGIVLILLAEPFKGERVVFLRQLESGLLVTGPFKVNGVAFRRVIQSHVIATTTMIDLSFGDVAKIADSFTMEVTMKKGEFEFFEAEKDDEEALASSRCLQQLELRWQAEVSSSIYATPHITDLHITFQWSGWWKGLALPCKTRAVAFTDCCA